MDFSKENKFAKAAKGTPFPIREGGMVGQIRSCTSVRRLKLAKN